MGCYEHDNLDDLPLPRSKKGMALLVDLDRFLPFVDNHVSLVHGHGGVFVKHARPSPAPPRHKIDKVFFAQ